MSTSILNLRNEALTLCTVDKNSIECVLYVFKHVITEGN